MNLIGIRSTIRHTRRWAPAVIAACAVAAVGAAPALVFGDSADADAVAVRPLPLGLVPPPQPAREPLAAREPGSGGITPTATPPSGGDRISMAARVDRATRSGIPVTALHAYLRAAATLHRADPGCGLSWSLVAAIGRVESNHGRFAGRQLLTDGRSSQPIIGLPLNGVGNVAYIADTDNGVLDQDPVYDRAVGPMQFIPSTWALVAVDGDGDGRKDPYDIDDAALATGVYLCAGNSDLRTEAGRRAAVFRYNPSVEYVELVLALAAAYESGQSSLPNVPASAGGLPEVGMNLPAATVGIPPALDDQTTDPTATASATTTEAPPTPTSPDTGTSPPASPAPTTATTPTTSAPAPTASPTTSSPTMTSPATTPSTTSSPTTSPPDPTVTCTPTPSPTASPTPEPTATATPCPSPTG